MNKLLIIFFSIVLFLLLGLGGILLFAFSQTGNEMLKPYVQQKLEAEIGMPVEMSSFRLESGRSSLDMVLNKQAVVHIETQHNLWNRSFEGSYHIKADSLAYGGVRVKDADIKGNFKGVSEDVYIDGEGTALGAALEYRFNIIDDLAQKIVVNMQGAQLAEVLQLLGYPALAEGKIDAEINMPEIGEDTASGYGHIVLNKAYFNRKLVKERYDYALPEKSYLHGTIDATLEGKKAKLVGDIQSNLFALQIKDTTLDMVSEQLRAAYHLDVKDMRILTKNKFSGPLKVDGNVERKDKKTLVADAVMRSVLGEVTLSQLKYDLEEKKLVSEYDVLIPDVNAFIPNAGPSKATAVSAKGVVKFKDTLSITGVTKGLGKRVEFSYDGKTAKVDASELSVEKALVLIGLPVYAKGTVDSHIDFTNLDPEEGTFSLKSTNLVAQPDEMKKLTGGALNMNAEIESSGRFKGGKGVISTELKSSLGNMVLDNMIYDTQNKILQSDYTIDIPSLKELQPLIDAQLYGPLVLKGQLSKEKAVKITGTTESLGGKIHYKLLGDDLSSTLHSVPLENIFGTMGRKKNFSGSASGEGRYNLKRKSGAVDLDIASFQIKPSNLTSVINMAIGKDPARVIYSSTKFHADIKGKITDYTLHATGSSSSIDITEGRLNTLNNTNTANFKFVYEKYSVSGKIQGSADNPKVILDTSALFKDKMDEKMQKKIDKAIGGKAGEFLKGLSF